MFSLRVAVLSSALAFTVACGGSYSSPTTPSPSPAPAPSGPSSPVVIPQGAEFLGNRAYNPDDITVATGATVTWTNNDSIPHTSTSDVRGWDSGSVAGGGRFSCTFQNAGTFTYHCSLHPGMVGRVIVQ